MDEKQIEFDENDALNEVKKTWLHLGRWIQAMIKQPDWLDSPEAAVECMTYAAQAEACFWRATGGDESEATEFWVSRPAKAIETGTAKTEGLGPKDDSAVGNADLPKG